MFIIAVEVWRWRGCGSYAKRCGGGISMTMEKRSRLTPRIFVHYTSPSKIRIVAFCCVQLRDSTVLFSCTGARVAAAAVDSILRRDAKEKHNLVVKARLILDGFKSVSLPAMNLHIGYVDSFSCATFMVQFSHERRNKRLVLL